MTNVIHEYCKIFNKSPLLKPYYLPLYDPGKFSPDSWREIHVGDVGLWEEGRFDRQRNIVGAGEGDKTQQIELWKTSPPKEIRQDEFLKAGADNIWCSSQLKCKQVVSSSGRIRYEIEKNDDKWAYALCCPREAIEDYVEEDQLSTWKTYMSSNVAEWKDVLNDKMGQGRKQDVVLVVGCVKTSQWSRLTLKARGVYTFEIDPESTGGAVLKLGDDTIVKDEDDDIAVVEGESDRTEAAFHEVHRAFRERGREPWVREYRRSYCLFIKVLKVDKKQADLVTRERKAWWWGGIA